MTFKSVFIAVVIAFALIVSAFLINRARPQVEVDQPTVSLVRATGKCAECHARQQYPIVHEYELSRHAERGINCLECHQPASGQRGVEHHGFTIVTKLTAGNCRSCHTAIYDEFLRSRHAGVSWAAVYGAQGLTPEQVEFAERYHPGYAKRGPHPLVALEGGRPRRAGVPPATPSASRMMMGRSGRARRATRAIPVRSPWRGCRPRAASVTWARIIRSSKSTKSRSTA